jgi:cis-3-alkyl-4-acyloxetan-2-one decarboxylase
MNQASINLRSGFENEYPFDSHYFELPKHRMHYVDEGEGEVLLFVHGNPTWSFAWRRLITDLSSDYNTIAIDHLGCGLSDKPQDEMYTLEQHITNLSDFVVDRKLNNITLVAHDWGGAIGMGVAARLPDRFSRFVLCNTAAFRSKQIPKRIAVCRIPFLGTFALRGLNAFSRAALTMAVEKTLSAEARRGFIAPYNSWANRVAVDAFVKDIPLKSSHRSYETLKGVEDGLPQFVDHPSLLIWGERDWCFTTEFLDEFEQRLPNAETLRIPDAGHYVFEDAPEIMISRIREFLTKHYLPTE